MLLPPPNQKNSRMLQDLFPTTYCNRRWGILGVGVVRIIFKVRGGSACLSWCPTLNARISSIWGRFGKSFPSFVRDVPQFSADRKRGQRKGATSKTSKIGKKSREQPQPSRAFRPKAWRCSSFLGGVSMWLACSHRLALPQWLSSKHSGA